MNGPYDNREPLPDEEILNRESKSDCFNIKIQKEDIENYVLSKYKTIIKHFTEYCEKMEIHRILGNQFEYLSRKQYVHIIHIINQQIYITEWQFSFPQYKDKNNTYCANIKISSLSDFLKDNKYKIKIRNYFRKVFLQTLISKSNIKDITNKSHYDKNIVRSIITLSGY